MYRILSTMAIIDKTQTMTRQNDKYVPPHARRSGGGAVNRNSPDTTTGATRAIFFGDSFIRLFGLVKNPSITVKPFKGASAKGLTRAGNDNRLEICHIVKSRADRTDRWVFCFGSVDVNLSYYHKKFHLNEGEIDLEEIAKNYVDFVASLPFGEQSKTTIVGIYPSPLEDEDVAGSLVNYRSIDVLQMDRVLLSEDILLDNRQERIQTFNKALKAQCQKHDLEYSDVFDAMIDGETHQMKDLYRDVSDHNIHVVWETTILLWLEKWEWLNKMAPPMLKQALGRSLREYLDTKAWAERRHPSQLEQHC